MANKRSNRNVVTLELVDQALANDLLEPATELDAVHAALRSAGIDPALLAHDAAAILREYDERSSTTSIDNFVIPERRRRPVLIPGLQRMNREQLVARVNALRSNGTGGGRLPLRLRGEASANVSEDDLRKLLEEIEALFSDDRDGSDEE